jgi:hypothetical protein
MVALIHRTGHTYGSITALHRVALPPVEFLLRTAGHNIQTIIRQQ